MDTAVPQKFPFNLDRNLAKANCTENRVCTSCDIVILVLDVFCLLQLNSQEQSMLMNLFFLKG